MRLLRTVSRWYPDLLRFELPPSGAQRVALTFDDGPHPDVTPAILDVLARQEATATFFFQGSNARRLPDIVRRAHAAGHQIAAHGEDHTSALKQTAAATCANASLCHQGLSDIVGVELPRYFRPPYGDMTFAGLRGLRREGFRLAYWSYDSNDSFASGADEVLARIDAEPPQAGSIVLFHDDYPLTAEALPRVLDALRGQGLSFATVADAGERGRPTCS